MTLFPKKVLVTGGAGFIGSAVCRHILRHGGTSLVIVDKLTYAANPATLDPIVDGRRAVLERIDIADREAVERVFAAHAPDAVIHLAAESHVDRSIDGPDAFVQTNVIGTYVLLEAARRRWLALPAAERAAFRFVHVSTDEVYGSLGPEGAFSEESPYAPNSPYSASKAAADHFARAWHHTYGLPVITTNCSNNYGPYQFPEKLIPMMILNGIEGRPLPVYGTGENVRDWLHVEDHAAALWLALTAGTPGERYNVGARAERRNIDVVRAICAVLDECLPAGRPHARLITPVADRPGHDRRYAIDPAKVCRELGWQPRWSFEAGLRATVGWYLEHRDWWVPLRSRVYGGERLGTAASAPAALAGAAP